MESNKFSCEDPANDTLKEKDSKENEENLASDPSSEGANESNEDPSSDTSSEGLVSEGEGGKKNIASAVKELQDLNDDPETCESPSKRHCISKEKDMDAITSQDHAEESSKEDVHDAMKLLECPNCSRKFEDPASYRSHLRTHLPTYYPYECEECRESFSMPKDLEEHKKSHQSQDTKGKKFYCEECSRSFRNSFVLNHHLLEHSRDPPYPCSMCDSEFPSIAIRSLHMKNHLKLACGLCRIPFQTHKEFWEHILETHRPKVDGLPRERIKPIQEDSSSEDEMNSSNENIEDLKCFVCEQSFSSKDAHSVHLKAHKVFQCSCCPKFFAFSSQLKSHEIQDHKINSYECILCNAVFTNACDLKLHQQNCKKERKDVAEDPYCTLCPDDIDIPTLGFFTEKLESFKTPIFDLNRASHFKWFTAFAERLMSRQYPLDDMSFHQILNVHKAVCEELYDHSSPLDKSEKYFYLLNVQRELSTMLTEHFKHV